MNYIKITIILLIFLAYTLRYTACLKQQQQQQQQKSSPIKLSFIAYDAICFFASL